MWPHQHVGFKRTAYLVLGGEGTLCTLGLAAQLLQGAAVLADVGLVLLLDELDKVVHHTVVKVLASQVGVSRGGNDLCCSSQIRHRQSCRSSSMIWYVSRYRPEALEVRWPDQHSSRANLLVSLGP